MPKKTSALAITENQMEVYKPTEDFLNRMSGKAQEDAKKENVSEFKYIGGVKNGVFEVHDEELGSKINAVVIASGFLNTYYDTKYNPNDTQPPACFAVGSDEYEMEAHDSVPKPVNIAKGKDKGKWEGSPCHNCPMNEFGSDGAGKACKNSRRIAILPLSGDFSHLDNTAKKQMIKEGKVKPLDSSVDSKTPEFREVLQEGDDEIYLLKISTTSLKNFKKYIKACDKTLKYPMEAVYCSIELVPVDDTNYYEFVFEPLDRLTEPEYNVVESVLESAERGVLNPISMEQKESSTAKKPAKRGGVKNAKRSR